MQSVSMMSSQLPTAPRFQPVFSQLSAPEPPQESAEQPEKQAGLRNICHKMRHFDYWGWLDTVVALNLGISPGEISSEALIKSSWHNLCDKLKQAATFFNPKDPSA